MMSDGDLIRIASYATVTAVPCPTQGTERCHVETGALTLCLSQKDLSVMRGLTDRITCRMEDK